MIALLAMGTTMLPSLQTPKCLQLIKGEMREVSLCTSFHPHPTITPLYAAVLPAA